MYPYWLRSAFGSPRRSWKPLLVRRRPGRSCQACCRCVRTSDKQKKMDRWMDKSYYKTKQKTRVCSSKAGCVSYSYPGWALLNIHYRSKAASFPQRTKMWRQGIIVHKEIFLIGVKRTPIPRAESITYADVKTQSAVRLLNAAITWERESVCLSAGLFVCLCLYRELDFTAGFDSCFGTYFFSTRHICATKSRV